jgi:transcription elongation factor Elf1
VALTQAELDTYEFKLRKRGFRRDDLFMHDCPDCNAQKQVLTYVIAGRQGGRDIKLCLECGKSRSFRSGSGLQTREEDPGFDLKTFLG